MTNRGVYFLANDRVYDSCVAFLNSFRKFNPDVPLCLIPFRPNMERIMMLSDRYSFSVFPDDVALSFCDWMSERTMGNMYGHFRKLAMWGHKAPFDEFIYIDVDMVVLKDISFAWEALDHCDFTTSHSNLPQLFDFVWKETARSLSSLSKEQLDFSANTGFIVSRRDDGKIWDEFRAKFRLVVREKLSEHFQEGYGEQPFLNYLIVTSGRPYSSLKVLGDKLQNVAFEIHGGCNPDEEGLGDIAPRAYLQAPFFADAPVFLIHWAGFPYDSEKWPKHSDYRPETKSFLTIYKHFKELDYSRAEP